MNIYGWFGVHKPNKYKTGRILHTVFERPYEITLERIKNPIFDTPKISTNSLYLKLVKKYLYEF